MTAENSNQPIDFTDVSNLIDHLRNLADAELDSTDGPGSRAAAIKSSTARTLESVADLVESDGPTRAEEAVRMYARWTREDYQAYGPTTQEPQRRAPAEVVGEVEGYSTALEVLGWALAGR